MSVVELEIKELFAVSVNSDLTEGRGRPYLLCLCATEATAIRLAKGRDVQGSNGTVHKVTGYVIENRLYTTGHIIEQPTAVDIREDKRILDERLAAEAKAKVLVKAKELGLTEEEIKILSK
jgi:hypothetical protein